MDFFDLIDKRESVSGYLDKKVEREKIEKVIEAARVAPSACNSQPWKFIIVDDDEKVKSLGNMVHSTLVGNINKFALTARNFIVVVDDKRNLTSGLGGKVKHKDYTSIDIGIASEHICLAATELGLGTCMMGWFNEKKIKKLLNIPKAREVLLVIAIGYYDNKEPRKKMRKQLNEIMSYNEY